ncbi:Rossmann-like and DUF2520 domain-containing protein [Ancylomarina longa]|uniref:DUF2520 domain-containing protein n=1 Tax=Ancylomarina longa TaxID=2487017 RepID=A0A434AW24_9BACT|nr:Rossmann-like and DUF2520 domain-containing protein [Ancylomarina longa]RUT78673.1 DUF2520 domain-containing protein [Ancylomarina longa]
MIQKIVILGAGNLATQLALALQENGIEILQIYSRTEKSAKALADQLHCEFTTSLRELVPKADLYIWALSDKALYPVLGEMPVPIGNVVHTAGSIPMDVFENYARDYGVFYPLQTFSKDRKVDFSTIPICVEASEEYLQAELLELGQRISNDVQIINSEQRKQLHLAAVFACNFTNHMYSVGQALLKEKGMDFRLLHGLISETAHKALYLDPLMAQTGPAVRFDEETMNLQEEELKETPEFQKLYRFVSESICHMHAAKKKLK